MADDGNSRTKARLNTHSIHLNTASFPCYPKNNPNEQPKKLEMTIIIKLQPYFNQILISAAKLVFHSDTNTADLLTF